MFGLADDPNRIQINSLRLTQIYSVLCDVPVLQIVVGPAGVQPSSLEKMFRFQMPNKTAGGLHEETAHSRSAKGVCLGTCQTNHG
jgi:hypothetical protein